MTKQEKKKQQREFERRKIRKDLRTRDAEESGKLGNKLNFDQADLRNMSMAQAMAMRAQVMGELRSLEKKI